MAKKTEAQRKIDVGMGSVSGGGETLSSTGSVVAPGIPTPGAPENLTLVSNTIARSSASAMARVVVSWTPPNGVPAQSYFVEAATDSGFSNIFFRGDIQALSATIDVTPATAIWIRVSARSAAGTSPPCTPISLTTATDTTASAQPTGFSATMIGAGDLIVTWTNPTTENFRDVEIRIWESASKTTLYHTGYSATSPYTWTAAANRQAGSGAPDPSVYIELRSRTWAGVLNSTSPPSATATKSAPGTPAGLASDFTGPDLVLTWTVATDAASYRLTLDGVARTVIGGRYVYVYDQNRQEHSGTADPVISVSLVAVDALDQAGSAATATATNAAPAAPASVTLVTGFSSFMASVSATEPPDFAAYRWRIIQTSPSAADITYDSQATLQTREVAAAASYQVGVRMVDVFGQQGTETLSSSSALDALTLADLRLDCTYRDSDSNTAGTLNSLKDGVTASGGVTYAA
jgi:hypothetical protein